MVKRQIEKNKESEENLKRQQLGMAIKQFQKTFTNKINSS